MAGKRLLDATQLFNATRNIAKQHVRIRTEQLDVWSKTSTVGKAAKNQTDRVTLTAQAATALARRLNEEAPSISSLAQQAQRSDLTGSSQRSGTIGETRGEVGNTTSGGGSNEGSGTSASYDTSYTPQDGRQSVASHDSLPVDDFIGSTASASGREQATPTTSVLSNGKPGLNHDVEPKHAAGPSTLRNMERPSADVAGHGIESQVPDVPEGVDVNVFRTSRGRRILEPGEGQEASIYQAHREDEATRIARQDKGVIQGFDVSSQPLFDAKQEEVKATQGTEDSIEELAADIAQEQTKSDNSTTKVCTFPSLGLGRTLID